MQFRLIQTILEILLLRWMKNTSGKGIVLAENFSLGIREMELLIQFERMLRDFSLTDPKVINFAYYLFRGFEGSRRPRVVFSKDELNALTAFKIVKIPTERLEAGIDILDAEFILLDIELTKYLESPLIYDYTYKRYNTTYFWFNRDALDPQRKFRSVLFSPLVFIRDEHDLYACYKSVVKDKGQEFDFAEFVKMLAISFVGLDMLREFVQDDKPGRKGEGTFQHFVWDCLEKLAKRGLVERPDKKDLEKIFRKLRDDQEVLMRLEFRTITDYFYLLKELPDKLREFPPSFFSVKKQSPMW